VFSSTALIHTNWIGFVFSAIVGLSILRFTWTEFRIWGWHSNRVRAGAAIAILLLSDSALRFWVFLWRYLTIEGWNVEWMGSNNAFWYVTSIIKLSGLILAARIFVVPECQQRPFILGIFIVLLGEFIMYADNHIIDLF